MDSSTNLSMDVIFNEILPRLPAKSLFRFKCVSKSFNSLISSKEFTQLYLNRYTHNADDLLILPTSHRIAAYNFDASTPPTTAGTFTWSQNHDAISVIGSCNGLLCIVRGNSLILFNPTTKICKNIQTPITDKGKNFGFGFDYINHDYKIVAIADQYNKQFVKTRINRVYSVNLNSWSDFDSTLALDSMLDSNGGVLIHDHLLHWMFWCPSLSKRRIGCFNVCSDQWIDDVQLPPYYYYYYYYETGRKVSLFDFGVMEYFGGCLFALFENKSESDLKESEDCFFDIWVMEEYGVQDSWFKLISIPFSEDLRGGVVPIAIRRGTGDVLVRQRHSAKLFWYNRRDDVITTAVFPRVPDFTDYQAHICQISFVTLPGN